MEVFKVILWKNGRITCQIKYLSIRIVEMIIPTLYGKKQKHKKMTTLLNQMSLDQREKVLIGKHNAFSMEKSLLQISSTLIAVKVATKLVPSLFKSQFWTKKMCRWFIKAVVKEYRSSCQWCNISWTMWINFFTKKCILTTKGLKLNTRLNTPRITQWNQILKNYAVGLMNKQLFTASELHAKTFLFAEDI